MIHGDPHIGNLFLDDGRIGFLDWGIIKVFSPMRDVSYFLTMAMSIDDRRRHESALLRHYLDVRTAAGGAPITFDEAWTAHRLHAAYTVPACCQIATFPPGQSERRRSSPRRSWPEPRRPSPTSKRVRRCRRRPGCRSQAGAVAPLEVNRAVCHQPLPLLAGDEGVDGLGYPPLAGFGRLGTP